MEDKVIQIKEQKISSENFSSFINNPKNSKVHKKIKGKKKLQDISNQIVIELNYENFELENETFYPQICKKENKIFMENVSLLDQSHFKFVVNQNSDIFNHYNKYKQNSFKNISWKDIELVYFYCNDNYTCPICLESKLCCPVITKCGHVYCFPCIISLYNYHMNISPNKKVPNCPLCTTKIEISSDDAKFSIENDGTFKLCQKIQNINYNNNMKIKFNLILRDRKSPTLFNLIYDPMLDNWKNNFENKIKEIPDEQSKEFNFTRILRENNLLKNKRLNEYIKDLNLLKEEFELTPDVLKKQSINECINQIDLFISKNHNETKDKKDILQNLNITKKISSNSSQSNLDKDDDLEDFNSSEDNIDVDINYKKYYLFYQEEKGDIYYLDPFIMEILLTEYGDYNSLPVEIEGKILDIRMNQVTPSLKSEYKYLNHLRIGSIIFFVEIDINDLISSSTKNIYKEKLYERNRLRNLLKNQEKSYENFINKKNSKIFEEEKNSSLENSKKSLENISGPIFFGTDEELGKNSNNNNNNEKDENKNMKESKLKLLFIEKEKEEKKEMEKEKVKEKEKEEIKEKEKKKKNKKGGIKNKNNKCGKKGKKKKKCDINEKAFNSESEHNILDNY